MNRLSLGRRLLSAILLGMGFSLVWGFVSAWLWESIKPAFRAESSVAESLDATSDGMPVIRRVVFPAGSAARTELLTLDREPLPSPVPETFSAGAFLGNSQLYPNTSFRHEWSRRLRVFQDNQPANYWYFIHDGRPDGAGYFVGYDAQTRQRIGYLGLAGLQPEPIPPEQRFAVPGRLMQDMSCRWSSRFGMLQDGWPAFGGTDNPSFPGWQVFVPGKDRITLVDLRTKSVREVLRTETPIASLGIATDGKPASETREARLVVRTADEILAVNPSLEIASRVVLPPDLADDYLTWYQAGEQALLVAHSIDRMQWSAATLYEVTSAGIIANPRHVELKSRSVGGDSAAEHASLAVIIPCPVAMTALLFLEPLDRFGRGDYAARLAESFKHGWPSLLAVCVVAVLLGIWTWRHGRKFGLPSRERLIWTVFVVLFGIPGLAGYLLHRHWPILEKCPHCHRPTPQNRDACPFCHTPQPAPEPTGMEVFA